MSYQELGPREKRVLGTAFYDAIYYSVDHSIGEPAANGEQGRRALILFSDGEDNSSAHHMLDAIESAQSNDVQLFSLRYTEAPHGELNARNKYGIAVMERIARETGGLDFDARAKGLAEGSRRIAQQLRGAYELAYHSTNSVRRSHLPKNLHPPQQAGLTVAAKTGYYSRD